MCAHAFHLAHRLRHNVIPALAPTPGLLVLESRSDALVIGGATVHPAGDNASTRTLG